MKLKTFVGIGGAALVALMVGGYFACNSGDSAKPDGGPVARVSADRGNLSPPTRSERTPRSVAPAQDPQPLAASAPALDGPDERAVDKAIMSWFGKNLGSDKRKDAVKGQPFKVNLYQDSGNTTVNRAKVDLDRDDKWDEKWTFKGSEISRKVSSSDDDKTYDQEFVWQGGTWVRR